MAYNSTQLDNLLALRLLKILTTPFEEFPAYKAGVIDEKGKYIVPKHKRTAAQRRNLTYLDRLMINIKKLINKLPGGESKLKNIVAAMVLIKECQQQNVDCDTLTEQYVADYVEQFNENDYSHIIKMWEMYVKLKEQTGVSAIAAGQGEPSHVANNTTSGVQFYSVPMFNNIIRRRDKDGEQDEH